MDNNRMRLAFSIILILYIISMVVGAVLPNPDAVPGFGGHTKYFHFFGFAILTILMFRTFSLFRKHWAYPLVFLIVFIILTEVLQLFVSTRHPSIFDMLIDLGGCLVGYGVYAWIYSRR